MISMDKQYRTRDGREVRIYAVDHYPGDGVFGAWKGDSGQWYGGSWDSRGTCCELSLRDLIEVKPKITRTYWLCHTSNATDCNLYGWTDKAEAEKWARQVNRTVSITGPHAFEFTEGDGL